MSKRVAEIVVDTLQNAGVRRCYGIVGDTLNHVTDALHRSEIEWVHVRHEEVAAFAAGADSLVSGELTACAGSCGPGSLHFINGVFESNRNRAPMVLIASQVVTSELGMEFPQEVDFKAVYASCSVFCEQVHSPEQARRVVTLACQAAISRRGVAVVILPADISEAEVKHDVPFSVHYTQPVLRPSDAELQRIAELLGQGRRIGIYAGAGCQGAHAQLLELARRLQAPIAHTSRAKDFVEPDNPYNMGMTGIFGIESGFHTLMACDTLLLLGTDFPYRQFYPTGAKIIQVDIRGEHIGRRARVDVALVGSVKDTLTQLGSTLRQHTDTHHLDASRGTYARTRAQLDSLATGDRNRTPVLPEFLTRRIDALSADDAVFIADVGTPVIWAARYLTMNGHRRLLGSFNHGSMANAVPQAIGAQASHPGRQVVTLSGDGGLSMMLGDLLTLTQSELPVKMIVFNNGALSFVEIEMKAAGIVNFGTGLDNPVFADVAQAMGIHADRVERPSEIDGALSAAFAHPGPALVEVLTARQELSIPPTINAAQVAGFSLWATKTLLSGRGDELIDLAKTNLGARLHRRKPQ